MVARIGQRFGFAVMCVTVSVRQMEHGRRAFTREQTMIENNTHHENKRPVIELTDDEVMR